MFQRAVQNFERWFVVTGVLELLDESMAVMEAFLPRYFKGVSSEYGEKINHNSLQPRVPFDVRQQIARNMTRKIEFCNIVKQKLFLTIFIHFIIFSILKYIFLGHCYSKKVLFGSGKRAELPFMRV